MENETPTEQDQDPEEGELEGEEEKKELEDNRVIRPLGKHLTQYAEFLIAKGVISNATKDKIGKIRDDPDIRNAEAALAAGDIQSAIEYTDKLRYITANKKYIESGTLIDLAIKQKQYDFAKHLLEKGYTLPPELFLKAITDGNLELISTLIKEGLYYQEDSIELEF